jgi:hypothetical protein
LALSAFLLTFAEQKRRRRYDDEKKSEILADVWSNSDAVGIVLYKAACYQPVGEFLLRVTRP